MNWKHLLWIIPLCLALGASFGFIIAFPSKMEVSFNVTPEMQYAIDRIDGLDLQQEGLYKELGVDGSLSQQVYVRDNNTFKEVGVDT